MSVTPAKGSVADPKDDAAKKFASSPAMYSANTIGSTDIKQCEKSLNLFNIYSIGWEDEFNKGLSDKQRKDLKDFRGIYLADGRVENIVNTK